MICGQPSVELIEAETREEAPGSLVNDEKAPRRAVLPSTVLVEARSYRTSI